MLTPEIILAGYARGIFPMAEGRDSDELFWVNPERRGIFRIGGFHVSRSLARRMRAGRYTASFDRDFDGVVAGCANRDETWINGALSDLYHDLHARGIAHSVEVWNGNDLVGGSFGIAIGGAWFGESMFSRQTDASKVALAVLHDRLRRGGFRLFDAQFLTPHLASLGAVEISRAAYQRDLAEAISADADFGSPGTAPPLQDIVHSSAQTS